MCALFKMWLTSLNIREFPPVFRDGEISFRLQQIPEQILKVGVRQAVVDVCLYVYIIALYCFTTHMQMLHVRRVYARKPTKFTSCF